ncbi:MAG: isochorismatase family protein [Dongiaceae bacterium]
MAPAKNGAAARQAGGSGLFDRERSCLLVIDVQQYFLDKLPLHERGPLVQRIAWLMRAARLLEVPIIATAEDIGRNGSLVPELAAELPQGTSIFNKMIFGLMGQPDIRAAVEATGRDSFALVGLETDVCISQSAFGLAAAGYRAAIIDDACHSPPPHHENGLRRLRESGEPGITATSVKGIYYEWVRDLDTLSRIRPQINDPLPPGLTL